MRLVVEQGFIPPGAQRQTVFQVWQQEGGLFLLREVPFDTVGTEQVFSEMTVAVHAMKSLMVRRGYEPKGEGRGLRAKHLVPDKDKLPKSTDQATPRSRFDRDDII